MKKRFRSNWRETDPKAAAQWFIIRYYGLDRWVKCKPKEGKP